MTRSQLPSMACAAATSSLALAGVSTESLSSFLIIAQLAVVAWGWSASITPTFSFSEKAPARFVAKVLLPEPPLTWAMEMKRAAIRFYPHFDAAYKGDS